MLFNTARIAGAFVPSAISVPVQNDWVGVDGEWSPVSIRVGSPPQWIDVLPNTASQETWAVGVSGCDGTTTCRTKRGGLFESNASTSWQTCGNYDLGMDTQLGFSGSGYYGFDTIELSDTLVIKDQIISIVNDTQYWLGYLGLGTKPTNFTNEDKPTFLSTLASNQSLIPSLSYGYTAGASYRLKKVPSSLTLGGYDINRFVANNVSFELDPNQSPVIALNGITVSANLAISANVSTLWNGKESFTLMQPSEADLFTIDSSTPYVWLPENVCAKFEQALGLTYDEKLRLYTFPTPAQVSQLNILQSANITFDFLLADLPGSLKAISISLPYKSFDLELSYGYPGLIATSDSPNIPYFPLKRASSPRQYTIGRAFLQESYLIVDYERNNFSVSQARFVIDALENKNIVDISSSAATNLLANGSLSAGSPSSSVTQQNTAQGLSKMVLLGIGLSIAVTVIVVTAIIVHCFVRRRYMSKNGSQEDSKSRNVFCKWFRGSSEINDRKSWFVEIGDSQNVCEIDSKKEVQELESRKSYELTSYDAKFYSSVVTPTGHNPQIPIELHGSNSDQVIIPINHNSQVLMELPIRNSTYRSIANSTSPESISPPAYFSGGNNQRELRNYETETIGKVSSTRSCLIVSPYIPGQYASTIREKTQYSDDVSWFQSNDDDEDDQRISQRFELPASDVPILTVPSPTHHRQRSLGGMSRAERQRFSWEEE